MSANHQGQPKRPLQVHQVRTALLKNYAGLIYEEDLQGYKGADYEQRFLSRALAADAVRVVTGCDHKAAGQAVIDGHKDQGIDALAVGDNSRDVWLVQAKWSDTGHAKLNKSEAGDLADGVRLIENREFGRFNDRIEPFTAQLDAALGDPRLQINLVLALMGPDTLADGPTEVLDRLRSAANLHGPLLRYEVLGTADFHHRLRQDVAPDPVNVEATMAAWIHRITPFQAWQGTVAVREVARWYEEHGDALYEENVRKSLGLTRINSGIKETLLTEPENFWYFNNGITVLCDDIAHRFPGGRTPADPVELNLEGVSVVNGAQTVTAIHESMAQAPEVVDAADIRVQVVSLGEHRPRYARRLTETTNTQNDVSQRDFIALDPAQAEIKQDFLLSLEKTYVYKRGEPDPAPEAGCSIVDAATALACAHRSAELAVRASQGTDLLWERGTHGTYPRLFGEAPTAYRIWRCVQVRRAVGEALEVERKRLHGRAADMARRGEMLIAHLVFQLIDQDEMDEPALEWEPTLVRVPELTASVLPWLIHHVDAEYGRNSFLSSTFTDETRCKQLARLVLDDVRGGGTIPVLPAGYRPPAKPSRKQRRPNAVPTLVNAGRLPEGTPLTYRPANAGEAAAVDGWIAEDPRRAQATWVNDRVKCLLWSQDGQQYSASALVYRIWELAGYDKAPVSVQGPGRWKVSDGRSLWDLAVEVMNEQNE